VFANAQKLRAYKPDAYLALGGSNPNRSFFEPYLLNLSGQKLVNEDYTLGFTEEQAAEAFRFIQRCYAEGVLFPLEDEAVGTYGNYQAYDWLNGNILCLPDYSSGEAAAKGSMDNVVSMPMWGDSEAANTGIMMRPTNMLAVNAKSPNVEEALKFVNYFFNDPEAIDTLKLVRSIPSTELAIGRMNDQGLIDSDTMDAATWAAEHKGGAGQNIISTNEQLEQIESDYISAVYYGDHTPEEAAKPLWKRCKTAWTS
jgi:oligogalacturonide transport system substrate-binding protein